jgi:hypothetical protein
MNTCIRYDALIFSPDFYRIRFDTIDKKKNNNEKIKKSIKRCWYCERECNTFISICELCQKYKKK